MSEKRRDSKGRILRTGESQRKDGLYQFRYMSNSGKRITIYDSDLQKLRQKEKAAERDRDDGINQDESDMTVSELVARYLSYKRNIRPTTKKSYARVQNKIDTERFGEKKIESVKIPDAKDFCIRLHESGLMYDTIALIATILSSAFQMGVNEDLIRKNPFTFRLSEIVPITKLDKTPLTDEQQEELLRFTKNDNVMSKYHDMIVVLLGTGVRVSELCGLTAEDIDFKKKRIRIDHQYLSIATVDNYICTPKSQSGVRYIPMIKPVEESLKKILESRPDGSESVTIDGYSDFVFVNQQCKVRTAINIQYILRSCVKKHNKKNPDNPLPKITPHLLRHTFATNMVNEGMPVKALQYIMGHSHAATTLDIYVHGSYENAEKHMTSIMPKVFAEEKQPR